MEKIGFTAGRIARLECPADKRQFIYWHKDTPGLGLRVTSTGLKSYVFEASLKNNSIRLRIGSVQDWSIRDAEKEANRLRVLIDQGIDPRLDNEAKATKQKQERALKKLKEMRVGDVWTTYLSHHEKRWGKRHLSDHLNLSQAGGEPRKRGSKPTVSGVLYSLLNKKLSEITPNAMIDWQKSEAEARPNNARQGFELFRAFWRWCASREEYQCIIDPQVVESRDLRAEVPSRNSKRFDVMERAHLQSWFDAVRKLSNPVVSAYLQGLLLTGARREELANLRWEDVDFRWGSFWIKDKVRAEGRKIPLTPYFSSLLQQLPRRNEWVFSSPLSKSGRIDNPTKPHMRALSVAGLPHVTLHGLRRTFSNLAEWVEMPTGIVAQIMGHAPNATAERHYKARPLELLAVWHGKYEAWLLKQAKVSFIESQKLPKLKVVRK